MLEDMFKKPDLEEEFPNYDYYNAGTQDKNISNVIEYAPIVTPEQEAVITKLYDDNPWLKSDKKPASRANMDNVSNLEDAWIQTFSGKKFFPSNPKQEDICIEDIAHALSMQCRFTGHCKEFYSVAQHSVLVSYFCNEVNRLQALLHDSSEAYISDISSPAKKLPQLKAYKDLEANIQKTIYNKFGLNEIEPKDVKTADLLMLGIEAQTLMVPLHKDWKFPINPPPLTINPLSPKDAERLFLKRFEELK